MVNRLAKLSKIKSIAKTKQNKTTPRGNKKKIGK
jgi:hypothetical protein